MLVYLKSPMGYTTLDGIRVYGKYYNYGSFGPSDIPFQTYKRHKDILEDAVYTKEWLESKFKKEFPDISFTVQDIFGLDSKTLISLARLVGVNYTSNKELTINERYSLRKSLISFLDRRS